MIRSLANANSRGMTLPELMVGLAVGMFVATVAISTFISTRTLNVVNSSSTRMTENARLATETLHTDLRSAGFGGCRTLEQKLDSPPVSALSAALNAVFLADGNSGVRGYTGDGSAHSGNAQSPALPTAVATAAVGRLLNSDIVSVRVPVDAVSMGLVASMTAATDAPQLSALATIALGDVLLISNCKAAALFQVTALPSVGGNVGLSHDATNLQHVFRSDSNVYRVQTRYYYVAPNNGVNSLWRITAPGALTPQLVATGIDRLVVTYGADTDATRDQNVNRYFTASAVPDWDRVLSARVQMLAVTAQDRMALVKQTYNFNGASEQQNDQRLRMVLNEIVTLRNGAP